MKNILSFQKIILFAVVFIASNFFTSNAQAMGPLGVTQTSAVQTFATADNTFDNGWKWVFDVTVPEDEVILKMKFADWVKGTDIISAGSNIRFYSEQSSNATSSSSIIISSKNTYSSDMYINRGVDLDEVKNGRQIQITVEARIPEGSAGGSYSTSYGISSVLDTTKPVITLIGDDSKTIEVGSPAYIDEGATALDNTDGVLIPILSGTVNTSVVGDYTITYNISDIAENIADAIIRTIHITDTTAPTITAPADVSAEATGQTTAVVLGNPITFDVGDSSPLVTNNADTTFPIGETTVIWTVTDVSGNSASTTQKVTIVDTTKPIITLTGESSVNVPVYSEYIEAGAEATDYYDNELTVDVTGDVNADIVGTYTVHYNTTDSNGNIASEVTRTVNVTARPITITADSQTKVFGTEDSELSYEITDGELSDGDILSGTLERVAGENVGNSYTINIGTLSAGNNYTINFVTSTLEITKAPVEITLSNLTEVYDGNPHPVTVVTNPADISTSVTYNGSETAPTSAGIYDVIATITNPNYSGSKTGSLVISKAIVEITASAEDKVYDGTKSADVTFEISGAVSGDTLTANGIALFNNKNVGDDKDVNITGITLEGANHENYTYNNTTTAQADITARNLIVTATGVNKVYDRTTDAQVTFSTNKFDDDIVTVTGSAHYSHNSDVENSKNISVNTISLGGADATNYSLVNTTATASANITAKVLTITGLTEHNKPYDGNPDSSLTGDATLLGVINDDIVTLEGTRISTFADKNVGTNKAITITGYELGGINKVNYTLTQPAGFTADITAKVLTGTITVNDRTYDGTPSATIATRELSGKVPGDDVSYDDGTATFSDKNVGIEKIVTAIGLSLGGVDAENYTVNDTATTNANITERDLTVTATGHDKVYDGNNSISADGTVTLSTDALDGDDITPHGVSYLFNDNTAGPSRSVIVEGITVDGVDKNNYKNPNSTANATVNINKATPVITWNTPTDVTEGTVLDETQLNATASVDGVFIYTPASGTPLPVGSHEISVEFTPTDINNYNTASKNVTININAVPPAPVTLTSILITHPASKLSYSVDEELDTTGLEVTGTYSDDSTMIVTPVEVTGFNSSIPVIGQVLTVEFGSQITSYTVDIN
ncbi:MAG TPA: YDG domain-containing protein [Candidatus Paceibacterota bacterium]